MKQGTGRRHELKVHPGNQAKLSAPTCSGTGLGRQHGSPGQASEVQVAPDVGANTQDDPQVHLWRQGYESPEEGGQQQQSHQERSLEPPPCLPRPLLLQLGQVEPTPSLLTEVPGGDRTQGPGLLPHKGLSPGARRTELGRLAGIPARHRLPLDQRWASCPHEGTTQDAPSQTMLAPPSSPPTFRLPLIRFIPCS